MIMPFTWFVRIPGLATFREANRFTELALVPMVLLAGAAVEWLRTHVKAGLIPILALALLETGWSGNPAIGTMPTPCPRWMARSPPSTPSPSWWTSRSASAAACP